MTNQTASFEQVFNAFTGGNHAIEVFEHEPMGETTKVSAIRGNDPAQAAKAMVVKVKSPTSCKYVLAVIPGDRRIDFKALAHTAQGNKASFADAETAAFLTGFEMGAVPPISFNESLSVIVDPRLIETGKIYFNAGVLDRSISVDANDFVDIVQPKIARIST